MLTQIPWRAKDVLVATLLISILALGTGIVDELILTGLQLQFLSMLDIIAMVVMYLVFIRKYQLNVRALYGLRYIGAAPACVVLALLVLVARIANANGWSDIEWLIQMISRLMSYEFVQFLWTNGTSVVFTPVWEELLIRGVLFTIVLRKFGALFAYVVPSLFFAILHLDVDVFYGFEYVVGSVLVMLFVESVIKTYVVHHTQSLSIVTLMHIATNITALAIQYLYLQAGYGG